MRIIKSILFLSIVVIFSQSCSDSIVNVCSDPDKIFVEGKCRAQCRTNDDCLIANQIDHECINASYCMPTDGNVTYSGSTGNGTPYTNPNPNPGPYVDGTCTPTLERCDSIDNDCDHQVDEGCDCTPGEKTKCGFTDEGVCFRGTFTCDSNGKWGDCDELIQPMVEVCDGFDNDCDGFTDETFNTDIDLENCGSCGNKCSYANAVVSCNGGQCSHECLTGYYDRDGKSVNGCEYLCPTLDPTNEMCDGVDNDCDGEIDEDFKPFVSLEHCGSCGSACDPLNSAGFCDDGLCNIESCESGWVDLDGLASTGCEYECTALVGGEVCNDADDDCDGSVDEGIDCDCTNDDTKICGSSTGACSNGIQLCEDGIWNNCNDIGPTDEVCDYLDNDCSGVADDTFDLTSDADNCGWCGFGCAYKYATGACLNSVCFMDKCDNDYWDANSSDSDGCEYYCELSNGGVELCDGLDNNCDGDIDELFDLQVDSVNCGTCGEVCSLFSSTSHCEDGGCVVTSCNDNYHDVNNDPTDGCEYPCIVNSDVELCNEIDDDCNGQTDENVFCGCLIGDFQLCESNVGECQQGFQVCDDFGMYGDCLLGVPPAAEICDGLDNDCDTVADDGFNLMTDVENCGECGEVCEFDNATAICANGSCAIDTCLPTFYDHDNDLLTGCEAQCLPTNNGVEACDLIDNDCDGLTDEDTDTDSDLLHCGGCGQVCSLTFAVSACDVGSCVISTCVDGHVDLDLDPTNGCEYTCTETNPSDEVGDNLDNDCNGSTDEGVTCFENFPKPCGTDVGQCEAGSQLCSNNILGDCLDAVGPQVEVCDGLDNDCSGISDDGFLLLTDVDNCGACNLVCSLDNATPMCVNGLCEIQLCDSGFVDLDLDPATGCEYACVGNSGTTEICNLVDDNCDGVIDEGFILQADLSNCGACGLDCLSFDNVATATCDDGSCLIDSCDTAFFNFDDDVTTGCETNCVVTMSGVEIMDSIDNDCNGLIDDGVDCFEQTLGYCGVTDFGICQMGLKQCQNGKWSDCVGNIDPSTEVCNDIDDDCDGSVDEDTDKQTDMIHCGSCNNPCGYTNADALCAGGSCLFLGCLGTFKDADSDLSNGCEFLCLVSPEICDGTDNDCDDLIDENFDTSSDLQNCGSCGNDCSALAGVDTAVCAASTCFVTGCDPNTVNLDADPTTGCECQVFAEVCDGADDDCDGVADNGFDLSDDFANCGSCGNDCTAPAGVAIAACAASTCFVLQCDPNTYDADGDPTNGCEFSCVASSETCDGADNDCDGLIDEDFDLSADASNCGSCNNDCLAPAGVDTAVCVGSTCSVTGCDPNTVNLDTDPTNGCECQVTTEVCDGADDDCDGVADNGFDLSNDTANCGSCGNDCSAVSNVTLTACALSTCFILFCDPGSIDFDNDPTNGCEFVCTPSVETCDGVDNDCDKVVDEGFDLATDVSNCGSCGNDCLAPANVVSATCGGNVCAITACLPGTSDVDGDPTNGCEVGCSPSAETCDGADNDCDGSVDEDFDLVNDINHCGACGNSCLAPATVMTATCGASTCTVTGCVPGSADSDGDPTNGCEAAIGPCTVTNGGAEVCDGIDNDCNGAIDEIGCPQSQITCVLSCFVPAEPIVWFGGPYELDALGQSVTSVTFTIPQICERGEHSGSPGTGSAWFDANCVDGIVYGGWDSTLVQSCVDELGQPVPYTLQAGTVGEAEVLFPGMCTN